MVATSESVLSFTFLVNPFNCSTICFAAYSIPLLAWLTFSMLSISKKHLSIIDLASTHEVVVPSPASDAVFWEACFNILHPKFSTGSESNILLATVTPSLVM